MLLRKSSKNSQTLKRTVVYQLLGKREDIVVFLIADKVAKMFDPSSRIHFLGDDQRLGIEIQRN